MGLAASQCRLLLLTARLSDTEYRAQMICQRRMALAMLTEQIATDYTRKLNNRTLRHVYALDANQNNTTIKEPMTYYTLTANNSAMGGGQFRVVLADGRIAVPSVKDIPGMISVLQNQQGGTSYVTKAHINQYLHNYTGNNEALTSLVIDELTDDDYATVYNLIKDDPDFQKMMGTVNGSSSVIVPGDGNEYVVIPALANTEYFQNAIRTGGIYVEQYQRNYAENEGWAPYDIIDSPYISDDLYTEDDGAAQAEYTAKTAVIQAQDKQLEMELKQVETQHQAAQTEYDSVKKVIEKNIERSFKTFG